MPVTCFFSSRRRHTRCALVTGVQTCARPIYPDRLRSLDPEAVTRLIGVPSYIRRDGNVTIWQYHAGGCVMDLFWYPPAVGPQLTHYEVRCVRLASRAEQRACFGDLPVRRRDTAATSCRRAPGRSGRRRRVGIVADRTAQPSPRTRHD